MNKITKLKHQIEKEKARIRSAVGANLKRLRAESELTQAELAEAAGMERTAITNIEAGKQNMTVEQVITLSDLLNSTPNELLCV